ncbi:Molybdopterin molybdenumtransferase [Meloidogyne graminicola]|uniref:Molybdopterin molybdenumtransferase n=1 Tax=Meloidogyne graminicola TaxID=189291 RepID=A0A8S9ZY82_9BILA|nr:Molybdopterin molybdenumtransferase [Meloidogyne graminicola]
MSLKRQSPWPAIEIKQAWQIIEETIDLYLEQLRLIEQKETNKKLLGSDGKGSRKVIGVSNAGILNEHKLINGQCIRISTGAKIPEGADAVVKLEDTEVLEEDIDGKEILIDIGIEPKLGQFIREIGSDVAKDELLLRKGTKLDPPEIGLVALSGKKKILVFKCPQICVISSGDELVDFNTFENNEWPNNGVMDTNRPLIISIIQEEGFEAIDCGIAIDSRESLTEVLNNAFTKANIIVISGGVSMGEKDLIKSILTENFNLKIHFGRVYMKPGLPTTFASGIGKDGHPKLVFALPGNPVSAFVSAHLFVIPQLRRISGLERNWENQRITVELINSIPLLDSRPEYKRAILIHSNKGNIIPTIPKAECLIGNQISSRLLSTRSANLLLELPTKKKKKKKRK